MEIFTPFLTGVTGSPILYMTFNESFDLFLRYMYVYERG
jgi:hypothetical protein